MDRRDSVAFLKGAPGDRALVARLLAGEDHAYRECYESHAPTLLRVVGRMLRNRAMAEEIVQETFVAAFRTLGTFREEVRLSSWLTGIAVRRALNALRGESRRTSHLPPPAESSSPEPWLADREMSRRVLAVLEQMDAPKRLALLLHAEGHTAAEIAGMTGEPRGTILARLSRGRAELAQRVVDAGLPGPDWLAREPGT